MLRKSLENWGLIYNNRATLNTIVFCVSIFYYNVSNAIDLEDYGLSDWELEINRFPFLIKNDESITIYKDKACEWQKHYIF